MTSLSIRHRPRVFDCLHRLRLVRAFSQTSRVELECLARHARGKTNAAEIGTFMGVSAGVIAGAINKDGRLFCIDPYDDGDAIRRIAMRHLARIGAAEKVTMIRACSQDAIAQLPHSLDFMFVDGDHSFDGLSRDWEVVQKLLGPAGIACFHDTSIPTAGFSDQCGASVYFDAHVRHADGFSLLETVQTLNVMKRNG